MGSGCFGQPASMENERSGPSRKSHGKKSSSRGGGSSSSNPEKPKQPQRGLGVAQLEKIRLHGQMAACNAYLPSLHPHPAAFSNPLHQEEMRMQAEAAVAGYGPMQGPPMPPPPFNYSPPQSSSSSYGYHPNMMIGTGDTERSNLRYAAAADYSSQTPRWNPNLSVTENQQPYMHPGMTTRHFLNSFIEGSMPRRQQTGDINEIAAGSSSQNSSDNDQDLDLELRL